MVPALHHIDMQRQSSDPDNFAILVTFTLFFAAAAALWMPGCAPVGDSGPSEPRGGNLPSYGEGEPNDDVEAPHGLPVLLTPGAVFEVHGTAGGDVVNSLGDLGTDDWLRVDAPVPCTVNVRVFIDDPAFYHLVLVEYNGSSSDYTMRASGFSGGSGLVELTTTITGDFGFGVLESGNGVAPGTPWIAEVYTF